MDKRGIFCIEGEWGNDLSVQSSVQDLVTYVRSDLGWPAKIDKSESIEYLPSIYRRAATQEEFDYLIEKWTGAEYSEYTVGYFAFHGSPGALSIGDKPLSLLKISNSLNKRCSGKHIIFSSCKTLAVSKRALSTFRKNTSARSVSGYTENTDWYECSALDLIVMTDFLYYDDPREVDNRLNQLCSGLMDKYGFIIDYSRPDGAFAGLDRRSGRDRRSA